MKNQHIPRVHAVVLDSKPGFLKVGEQPMDGTDRFQRILELTGSTTPPPPKLEIPQQDDTVTESEVEEVAEVCLTPKKVKEEENTAPSSNEKIDYSTTMPEIKLFTDESREQELKKRKAREFGE